MLKQFYTLRCGIIVQHIENTSSGSMVVKIVSTSGSNLKSAMAKYWETGREHVLTAAGEGHQWGRDFDIVADGPKHWQSTRCP